ncbi:MAG: hypothetical protein K1X91_16770 [Bacteriodetes bacterium]|nr:hypothetical protein [Bacteroidota bacterium]
MNRSFFFQELPQFNRNVNSYNSSFSTIRNSTKNKDVKRLDNFSFGLSASQSLLENVNIKDRILESAKGFISSLPSGNSELTSLARQWAINDIKEGFPVVNTHGRQQLITVDNTLIQNSEYLEIQGDDATFRANTIAIGNGKYLSIISEKNTGKNIYYQEYQVGKFMNDNSKSSDPTIFLQSLPDLFTLNFTFALYWLSMLVIAGKHEVGKKGNKLQTDTPPCFSHDFKCTTPGGNFLNSLGLTGSAFANDGKEIKLWFPCSGTINIDVSECCKNHDIALWCSTNAVQVMWHDLNVIACFVSKVAIEGAKKIKVLCGIIIDYSVLAFYVSIGLRARYAALFSWIFEDKLWDHEGSHQKSCLCGGTMPTTFCPGSGSSCVDLCAERGKKADCYKCKWKCIYDDVTGKVVRVEPDVDKYLPCCPGTDIQNNDVIKECNLDSPEVALTKCQGQPCDRCFFRCEYNAQSQLYWRYYGSAQLTGKPCCKPAPTIPKWPNICTKEGQISW